MGEQEPQESRPADQHFWGLFRCVLVKEGTLAGGGEGHPCTGRRPRWDEGSPGGEVQPLEPGETGEEDHAPGEHVGFQILGAFLTWR